jgi:hypothetical protein
MLGAFRLGHRPLVAVRVCALVLAGGLAASCGVPRPVGSAARASAAVALVAVSSPSSPTAGAVVGFAPAKRGPGAVLTFDPKTAPAVPKGMDVHVYIASYYRALIDKKWGRAFRMVPKTGPEETLADFKTLQYGYEVGSFTIVGRIAGAGTRVLAVHVTPGNGVWNTTWEFVSARRGTLVKDLIYARPGGAGCH